MLQIYFFLRFLCLQRCGLVSMLGWESPALLAAITLNWYHLPSLKPGTRASKSSILKKKQSITFLYIKLKYL
jgi:hypothetical protein